MIIHFTTNGCIIFTSLFPVNIPIPLLNSSSKYKGSFNYAVFLLIIHVRVHMFNRTYAQNSLQNKMHNSIGSHKANICVTSSVQFSLVAQSCPTLCNPVNHSTPGLPVHHQLLESTQTHVHRVSDAIQPSHPLSSPSPPAPNPSQHQSLFQ